MNCAENIKCRKQIMDKVYNGEKITKQERAWLMSNPLYNERYDTPILMRDVISLVPKRKYLVKISVLNSNSSVDRILPVIGVAHGKGGIKTPFEVLDIDEKVVNKSEVKMLVPLLDRKHPSVEVEFESELGILFVEYECTYYDTLRQIRCREMSNLSFAYGMIKEQATTNKVLYRCKSPLEQEFDALIFGIEWKAL